MPISISGGDELLARLERLKADVIPAAKQGLDLGLKAIVTNAKANCPVGDGNLHGSIQAQSNIDGDTISATVYSPLNYAVYVEMGTGPEGEAQHSGVAPVGATYRPTGWTYHDEDGFHYTRGQPARPFLYPAFKANVKRVLTFVSDAIRKSIKGG